MTIRHYPSKISSVQDATGSLRGIDYRQTLLEHGCMFISNKFAELEKVDKGGQFDILLESASDPLLSPRIQYSQMQCEKLGVVMETYFGSVLADKGTLLRAGNLNVQSQNLAATKVYYNPTVTDYGMLVSEKPFPDKYLPLDIGDQQSILSPDTQVMLRFVTSKKGMCRFTLQWYEQIIAKDSVHTHSH